MFRVCFGISLFLMACTLGAQDQLSFDVASIRPAAPVDQARAAAIMQSGGFWVIGPRVERGRASFTSMDLKALIGYAYGLKPWQIAGPDWMTATRFDIQATMPGHSSAEDAQRMLQSLLKERFGLVARRSAIEHPVLALTLSKGGLKMAKSGSTPQPIDADTPLRPREIKMENNGVPLLMTVDGATITWNMGVRGIMIRRDDPATHTLHLELKMTTMEGFATMLTQIFTQLVGGITRPIVDQTGIAGNFDASLDVSLLDMTATAKTGLSDNGLPAASDPGGAPSLPEALQKLGLRLQNSSAKIDQLIIDHLEKMPSDN